MSLIRFLAASRNMYNPSPLARLNMFQHEISRHLNSTSNMQGATSLSHWSPALDLYQDKDSFFVKIELPGMKKENVTLSLHDDLLTVIGVRHPDAGQPNEPALRTERFFGRFERTIELPTQVEGTRVSTSYENGVLTINLPKVEAAKPRQIEIGVR